jgi:periplasmic glucans biosynthesis protein
VLGRKGLYRTVLDLRPNSGGVADARLQLRTGDRAVSEYVHYPVGG